MLVTLTYLWFSFAASATTSAGGGGGGHDFSLHDEKQLYSASAAAAAAAAAAVHSAVPDVASVLSPSQLVGSDRSIIQEMIFFGKDLDPNLVLQRESMIVVLSNGFKNQLFLHKRGGLDFLGSL